LTDPVSSALQRYADRGVFRGFRAVPGPRGRVDYVFLWLLRRPMTATFDPRRGVLVFPSLFPAVNTKAMAVELKDLVTQRSTKDQPAHKRIDGRRASITCALRKGTWSLTVNIRGANHDYAVRGALNLINELFLALQNSYPEYLVEHFGLSTE
jgi:hypothetical protein